MIGLRGLPDRVVAFVYGTTRKMPKLSILRGSAIAPASIAPIARLEPSANSRAVRTNGGRPQDPTAQRSVGPDGATTSIFTNPKSSRFLKPMSSASSKGHIASYSGGVRPIIPRSLPLPEKYTITQSLKRTASAPNLAPTSLRTAASTSRRSHHFSVAAVPVVTPNAANQIAPRRNQANLVPFLPIPQSPWKSGGAPLRQVSRHGNRTRPEPDRISGARSLRSSRAWAPSAADPIRPLTDLNVPPDRQAARSQPTDPPYESDASQAGSEATEIHLDGQVLGQWMLDHVEHVLSRPPTTANFVTSHGMPIWPGQSPLV